MDEINEVCKVSMEMWNICKKLKKNAEYADSEISSKIARFQKLGFGEFINKYVIPVRYMLAYNEFNLNAFRKYLLRLKTVGFKSKDEWADRQADYVKLLWRSYNPHGSTKEAHAQWQYARANIKDETSEFEKDYEKAKNISDEKTKEVLDRQKDVLKTMLDTPELQKLYETMKPIVQTPKVDDTKYFDIEDVKQKVLDLELPTFTTQERLEKYRLTGQIDLQSLETSDERRQRHEAKKKEELKLKEKEKDRLSRVAKELKDKATKQSQESQLRRVKN